MTDDGGLWVPLEEDVTLKRSVMWQHVKLCALLQIPVAGTVHGRTGCRRRLKERHAVGSGWRSHVGCLQCWEAVLLQVDISESNPDCCAGTAQRRTT
jgi:hypothetical protein